MMAAGEASHRVDSRSLERGRELIGIELGADSLDGLTGVEIEVNLPVRQEVWSGHTSLSVSSLSAT
jgi:hypothetical protein